MKIKEEVLRDLYVDVLEKNGLDTEYAKTISDALIYGDLKGKPHHGIMLLSSYVKAIRDIVSEIKIESETSSSALIDGGGWPGPIVAKYACDLLLNKLKAGAGIVTIGAHNKSPYSIAGIYTEMIAKENYIGILMCNSRARIAGPGSYEPTVGPNPISIGIPSDTNPIIVDVATSAITVGDVRKALTNNEKLPDNVAYNKEGQITTDPQEALDGSIFPLGGHKGFSLGLAIELLAGPLVKGKAGKNVPGTRGYLFIGINPEIFGSVNEFKNHVETFKAELKQSKKLPGVEDIYIPGEHICASREAAKKEGIEIEERLLDGAKELL